jgi:RNase adaptor protein for sRNA GlmZ degradation
MHEERRPLDPTRKMLKIFGVKVTDYEERTAALLERATAVSPDHPTEWMQLALEVIELTANMNAHLREMTGHVLDTEARVLSELRGAFERAQP